MQMQIHTYAYKTWKSSSIMLKAVLHCIISVKCVTFYSRDGISPHLSITSCCSLQPRSSRVMNQHFRLHYWPTLKVPWASPHLGITSCCSLQPRSSRADEPTECSPAQHYWPTLKVALVANTSGCSTGKPLQLHNWPTLKKNALLANTSDCSTAQHLRFHYWPTLKVALVAKTQSCTSSQPLSLHYWPTLT